MDFDFSPEEQAFRAEIRARIHAEGPLSTHAFDTKIEGERGMWRRPRAAKVRVHVEWSDHQRSWATVGVSENVIEASWRALEDAIQLELMRMNQRDTLIEKAVEDYSWGV